MTKQKRMAHLLAVIQAGLLQTLTLLTLIRLTRGCFRRDHRDPQMLSQILMSASALSVEMV